MMSVVVSARACCKTLTIVQRGEGDTCSPYLVYTGLGIYKRTKF